MLTKYPLVLPKLFGVFGLAFILQGCGPGKPGIYANDQIDAGKRKELHTLNTTVLQNLKANQFKALQFDFCKDLLDDGEMIRKVERISNEMKQDTFSLLAEYHIISKPDTAISIKETKQGINNHNIHFKAIADETYMAFFVQRKPADKLMLTAIYSKYDYGWKLTVLELNPYTIMGKTGPELFELAKERYTKGYLIDAVNATATAQNCFGPSNEWEYQGDAEMNIFYNQVISEANTKYKLPIVVGQLPTHPQIIRVFNQKMPEGQFPMIYYLSKISLKDTVAIKKENAELRKAIGAIMPGIDMDKKYVLYAAFNQKPNIKTAVEHFDMTDKLQ